ncbi:hypothetical protein HYT24_03390 [Candidatus Pacearchaeota archaeon]|nr:hypothetical protein [Candidatus Pacearchaeota archaeon]
MRGDKNAMEYDSSKQAGNVEEDNYSRQLGKRIKTTLYAGLAALTLGGCTIKYNPEALAEMKKGGRELVQDLKTAGREIAGVVRGGFEELFDGKTTYEHGVSTSSVLSGNLNMCNDGTPVALYFDAKLRDGERIQGKSLSELMGEKATLIRYEGTPIALVPQNSQGRVYITKENDNLYVNCRKPDVFGEAEAAEKPGVTPPQPPTPPEPPVTPPEGPKGGVDREGGDGVKPAGPKER